jgi:RNA polymerase sigma-70 factor, ECF subfamily
MEFNFEKALVEESKTSLLKYAVHLLRGSTDYEARDLVQEVCITALRKRHMFQQKSSDVRIDFRRWLSCILHNQFVNIIRRSVKEKGGIIGEGALLLQVSHKETQLGTIYAKQVVDSLKKLPKSHIKILRLVQFDGLTYEQAAAIEGVPIGTIRSRLARGKVRIREMNDYDQNRI